ncbi:MAG: hypothetical protein Q7T16_05105 [Candidatus Burarchaeum sp.]|nr:hypothetical protein [Candidatus Burarchaeum sp.]MDO8340007.1 hypothetical protein [Candidatus Burarchaeum sp.]
MKWTEWEGVYFGRGKAGREAAGVPARIAFGRHLLEMTGRIGQFFRDAHLDSASMEGMNYFRVTGGGSGIGDLVMTVYKDDPVTNMLRKDPLTVREVDAVMKETAGKITVEYLAARRKAQDRERGQEIAKRIARFRAEETPTPAELEAHTEKLLRMPELHRNRRPGIIVEAKPKQQKQKLRSHVIEGPFGIYG